MKKEILISFFPYMTHARYQQLLRAYGSLDVAWHASAEEIEKKAGWKKELAETFITWKKNICEEYIHMQLAQEHITCITQDDPAYPTLLKELFDPPFCLFIRGTLQHTAFPLAVVGPRKSSSYGRQVTKEIIPPLVHAGVTIVSGLALGIDGIAHTSALTASGITVAVLGGGIDDKTLYPRMHRDLAKKIVAGGGAVISEYPPGIEPTRYSFPKRNRIIAGMSLGTLVIEATARSGALVTAQAALDTNRDIFAIPQHITAETSIGTNTLLKEGAHLITSYHDILEVLHLQDHTQYVTNKEILPDSPAEATILAHLSREAIHVDQLIRQSKLPSSLVMSTLTLLEMKGVITNIGGMMYVLNK
ncbi:MAG: DNA-protecting protein DprA [Candidatus Magasanikbacteria bacterium CG10_big_fil_rev_8_21_14_0_10_43_6]|uniref:DNA-protecting protein DprA n=1 Tax=Candidatus Magasanikbacteria bacterium CG10_big_fil_rev_8_21_14_0_10_43_6 TaxID=1974650 RepID=A0A2M6W1E6_9BACT|nr:MAG: DNA-protecting protein DprA [Candidatus Magasanikbacteria bacterium CG10_big_fil_rev_8_21_14_0_10_43_6]